MQSKADSFSAYLEAKQKSTEAPKPAGAAGGTALSLLAALSKAPQMAMGISELQQASGMSFLEFSQALKRLQDSGYCKISGEAGQEQAALTRLGMDVASLAG